MIKVINNSMFISQWKNLIITDKEHIPTKLTKEEISIINTRTNNLRYKKLKKTTAR